ncbi:ATP-binding cassette domain-containing protein [Curtobacterium ammoniigenes]|uniref:ATP-binding cassette domain-containing protein n=1 Tax=Curtobacterium ammoniigenes TaxID=395387 RepID=UPI0008359294|nr:ATP-binding cassette domain-containing protein [Curtobacterium ammoniigenes]
MLDGLTLTIKPGERVLLAGPSGSGKSTLLRALVGGLETQGGGEVRGSIRIDGAEPERALSGLLLQDPRDATVAETVGRDTAFGLENRGVPRTDIWERVRSALTEVRLPQSPDRAVRSLSGGEAQRLALAGVLVLGPGLLLLDEPTSMLDPVAAGAVREAVVAAVEATGATLVLVEHRCAEWMPIVDRVIALSADGSVIADGDPAAVFSSVGATLIHDGVWVPGAPQPLPVPTSPDLLVPSIVLSPGSPAVSAARVSVDRSMRSPLARGEEERCVRTLDSVDVVAVSGSILAIVGPSGAGKSTLSGLLAGLEAPTAGAVRASAALAVAGDDRPAAWPAAAIRARIGWVPQDAELAVLGRTVRQDVLVAAERPEDADRILELLDLAPLADSDPHQLSGGEQRRLAVAAAIAQRPAILVLDEPTVGQDRRTWSAVTGLLLAAREAGVAVVVTTHDPNMIALADRVLRLDAGHRADRPLRAIEHCVDEPPDAQRSSAYARPPARSPGLALRCGPLALVGAAMLLLIGSLGVTGIPSPLAGILAWLALAPFVARGARLQPRRLLPGAIAALSVGFSSWLLGSPHSAAVGVSAGLRIAFFVLPGIWLAGLIEPSAFGDHLAQRLHLPARPVVAASAALQQFDRLAADWQQLRAVRRMRGVSAGRSPGARGREFAGMTFALLVRSLRTAARMSVAMDARGFSAAHDRGIRRSWAEAARWGRADTTLIVLAAVVAAIPTVVHLLVT